MRYDAVQFGAAGYPHLEKNPVPPDKLLYHSKHLVERALLVDPNPAILAESWVPSGWVVDCCAWGPKDGSARFYIPRGNGRHPGDGDGLRWELASLEPQRKNCAETIVRTKTFRSLAKEHGISSIDRLIVDVEGFDDRLIMDVLHSWMPFPKSIFWEYGGLPNGRRDKIMYELSGVGYFHTTLDNLNRVSILR